MATRKDMRRLIEMVHDRREELGLSKRKLGELTGLSHTFIAKLEAGQYESASAETLMTFAEALDIPPADLFSLAGYRLPQSLPSFGPYLRTRYGEVLSDEDQAVLSHMFEALRSEKDQAKDGGGRP